MKIEGLEEDQIKKEAVNSGRTASGKNKES
jgi:hypothetical protein